MKLDIAINYVCSWFFFYVSTLMQALKECKTYDFSVFAAKSLAVALKKESGLLVTSSSLLCSMEDIYRVNKLIRCLIS